MAIEKIPCGGFYYDDANVQFEKQGDKIVLKVIGGKDDIVDYSQFIKKIGDAMEGNLDMNGNTINDVDIIANQVSVTTTDKQSAIHIRVNETTKELSIYKESSDTGEQLPLGILNVDTPTKDMHATNKKYVDNSMKILEERMNAFAENLDNARKNITNLTQYKIKYEQLMKKLAGEI